MAHEGVACDRCGMAPLRGPRFLKPATRNPSPSSGDSESGGGTSSTSSSSGGEMNLCASDFGALPDDAKAAFFEVLAPGAPPTSCRARAAAGSVADPAAPPVGACVAVQPWFGSHLPAERAPFTPRRRPRRKRSKRRL